MSKALIAAGLLATFACGTMAHAQGAPPADSTPAAAPRPAQQPGKPANLCQELTAFIKQPAATVAAAAPPPQQATAVQAPSSGQPAPKPPAGGVAQETSGITGPVTQGGPGATGPQGAAQSNPAAQQAGQGAASAPTPAASSQAAARPAPTAPPPPAPRATQEQIAQIETATRDDDLKACRTIAQQMRRAGVKMSDPLLALSALDLKYLEAAKQQP